MLRPTMIAVALLLPLATMSAAGAAEGGLTIDHVWARATPGKARVGGVYFRIASPTDDRLLAVDSPVAVETELHSHRDENGTMKMRLIEDGVAVTAGETLELQPGEGVHAMLLSLRRPLKVGDTFPLTLYFERAGMREVIAKVEPLGAMAFTDDAETNHDAVQHGTMDHNAMDHSAINDGSVSQGAMQHDGQHPAGTPGS